MMGLRDQGTKELWGGAIIERLTHHVPIAVYPGTASAAEGADTQ